MRLRSKIVWTLLLVVMLAGTAYWQMRKTAAPSTAASAPMASANTAPVLSEQVVELQSSDLLTLRQQTMVFTLPVSGNLKALNTVTVKARTAGELLSLAGREGDTVKASQVLAKIDPAEYQRKLRQAEQQADAAKTQIDIAQRQYDNNKALVDQGFISKTALEASEATLAGAKATYNAALAGADVARKTLNDTVLLSPISGQISARLAQPGERVGIDQKLLDIVDLSSLELEATLSPADSMDVRVGQAATLTLEGRDQPVNAQVQRINPNVQSGSRSVLVYLKLQSTQGLRQGLYGQGQLELGRQQVLAVPLEYVRTDKPEPYVQVLNGSRLSHQAVTLGKRGRIGSNEGAWVEIKGIEAGAQVLSSRVGAMREGLNLRVVSDPSSSPANKP
ncbi:MAG: efflux RND transporter periplasmic adaptor subunit [Burkholderiales bacterium]|nr:efflux RND transporter periplasmic adaptor subunit [Burkholderiales bacterium]